MSKTILYVDDSSTMLLSVRASLEMAGFKVVTASDGVQALAALANGLILLTCGVNANVVRFLMRMADPPKTAALSPSSFRSWSSRSAGCRASGSRPSSP